MSTVAPTRTDLLAVATGLSMGTLQFEFTVTVGALTVSSKSLDLMAQPTGANQQKVVAEALVDIFTKALPPLLGSAINYTVSKGVDAIIDSVNAPIPTNTVAPSGSSDGPSNLTSPNRSGRFSVDGGRS